MKRRYPKMRVRGSNAEAGGTNAWSFGFPQRAELSRRAAAGLLAAMIAAWLVAGSYLVLVSRTAVAARRIQAMREELALLQRENAVLEQRLARLRSVDRLYQAAKEEGFIPAEQVEFVEP